MLSIPLFLVRTRHALPPGGACRRSLVVALTAIAALGAKVDHSSVNPSAGSVPAPTPVKETPGGKNESRGRGGGEVGGGGQLDPPDVSRKERRSRSS